jgi:ParB-like chromosome segregation protein Spo0J
MPIASLSQLTPDPHNRRKHNPRNVGMLREALAAVGAARSIVIDETGEILAGNGLVEAARAQGLDKVQVVDVEGDTVVAVRRSGLSAEQKRALAIYDNRTAELAEWDWPQLAVDHAVGLPLEPWFTRDQLVAAEVIPAAFAPVAEETQGRLDQKAPIVCPECGHVFTP